MKFWQVVGSARQTGSIHAEYYYYLRKFMMMKNEHGTERKSEASPATSSQLQAHESIYCGNRLEYTLASYATWWILAVINNCEKANWNFDSEFFVE